MSDTPLPDSRKSWNAIHFSRPFTRTSTGDNLQNKIRHLLEISILNKKAKIFVETPFLLPSELLEYVKINSTLIKSWHIGHSIWGNSNFALLVTVYEIIKFNRSKWSRIESKTLKSRSISWATTSPNISLDGVLMAYMIVKQWRIYLKPFSCVSTMRRSNRHKHTHTHINTHTHTHTHTYTDIHSNECNRRECNALHFA